MITAAQKTHLMFQMLSEAVLLSFIIGAIVGGAIVAHLAYKHWYKPQK